MAGSTLEQLSFGSAWDLEVFRENSDYGEEDYRLRIEDGTATIQFCRTVHLRGIIRDAQREEQLTSTLLQFVTVNRVVILRRDGHCLFDSPVSIGAGGQIRGVLISRRPDTAALMMR